MQLFLKYVSDEFLIRICEVQNQIQPRIIAKDTKSALQRRRGKCTF